MGTLFVFTAETDGEWAHKSDKLLGWEITLSQTVDDETARMRLGSMLDCISLWVDIASAHVEDHGWATTVLNGCITTELDQVGSAQQTGNVVTSFLDLLDLLDSEVKFFALSDGELILKG